MTSKFEFRESLYRGALLYCQCVPFAILKPTNRSRERKRERGRKDFFWFYCYTPGGPIWTGSATTSCCAVTKRIKERKTWTWTWTNTNPYDTKSIAVGRCGQKCLCACGGEKPKKVPYDLAGLRQIQYGLLNRSWPNAQSHQQRKWDRDPPPPGKFLVSVPCDSWHVVLTGTVKSVKGS